MAQMEMFFKTSDAVCLCVWYNTHMNMNARVKKQLVILAKTALYMAVGIALFKYVPMWLWGADILFDASLHMTAAIFVLYVLWFFVDQNKTWRVPFFLLAATVIAIVSLQRIAVSAHNDIWLLGGLCVSVCAIFYARKDTFKKRLRF